MQHLYVDWAEYHRLIERLALSIHRSGWQFDSVIALARGGLRVGDLLSRIFWVCSPPAPIVTPAMSCSRAS